jgi:dTDP-4-dehydrorhamnose reductase
MKILLFGSTGQVGRECIKAFESHKWNLVSLTRAHADFSDPESVYQSVIDHQPDIVVNACAYTAVDKAELEPELAHLVNAASVSAIGKACSQLDIPVVHISTDYVFDGLGVTPYCENDAVAPTGVYGSSKLLGEQQLLAAHGKSIILRTSWVFSVHGNNFVKTMLRLGRERDEVGVVADQFGCPTSAGHIARVIADMVKRHESGIALEWGIYHCSNRGECSWYDFAVAIFESGLAAGLLDKIPKVYPITTADYPTPATRPAYSVLNCERLERYLGYSMPLWTTELEDVSTALK